MLLSMTLIHQDMIKLLTGHKCGRQTDRQSDPYIPKIVKGGINNRLNVSMTVSSDNTQTI